MAQFSKPVGPVEIVFGGTALGLTLGGATLTSRQNIFRSVADATGDTARGKYVTGEEVMLRAAITEATHAQIAKIFGSTVEGSTTEAVTFKSQVGKDLLDNVAECILKPIDEGVVSTTAAGWIYIPAATIMPAVELAMQIAGQRAWAFEVEGHPVKAEHIASGGHLYNSGSPEYSVKDLVRFGKASSS